ncbi:MAG: hypothetical protein CME06_00400 [Gemmatimonadetes bacterium]|nr:hypothetical protein [Gemmatimonadota bacterium]
MSHYVRIALALPIALLISACASVGPRGPSNEIIRPTAPPPVREESKRLREHTSVRVLEMAFAAYEKSIASMEMRSWDQAYRRLDETRRLLKYTVLDEQADSLIALSYEMLAEEIDLRMQFIEPNASPELIARLAPKVREPLLSYDWDRVLMPIDGSELRIARNARVDHYLALFSGPRRRSFERSLGRAGRYLPMMTRILASEGVPAELAWLPIIESGMQPNAVSRAKAVGLWQFIRSTGSLYGLEISEFIDERRNPERSTHAAARHLRDLHEKFRSWPLALAAYNCGARRVERAIERAHSRNYWLLDLPRETRNYVPQFYAAAILARRPEAWGLVPRTVPPEQVGEVVVPGQVGFRTIARCAATTEREIKELNPHLLHGMTPPRRSTRVRVPSGSEFDFAERLGGIPQGERLTLRGD